MCNRYTCTFTYHIHSQKKGVYVEHVAVRVYWYIYERNMEILNACADSVYLAVFSPPPPNGLGTRLVEVVVESFIDSIVFYYGNDYSQSGEVVTLK